MPLLVNVFLCDVVVWRIGSEEGRTVDHSEAGSEDWDDGYVRWREGFDCEFVA